METKNKNEVSVEDSPPSSPRQNSFVPDTPPRKPRNNGFIRDVSKKVNSPYNRSRIVPSQKLKQKQALEKDQSGGPTHQHEEKQVWEGDEFDLLSLEHKAAEELYKRPKSTEIKKAVTMVTDGLVERLKELSMNNSTTSDEMAPPDTIINEGIEIADLVSLLKINGTSSKSAEIAGQKAQRAATLMLQAQMISHKAKELLAQSKQILQNGFT